MRPIILPRQLDDSPSRNVEHGLNDSPISSLSHLSAVCLSVFVYALAPIVHACQDWRFPSFPETVVVPARPLLCVNEREIGFALGTSSDVKTKANSAQKL